MSNPMPRDKGIIVSTTVGLGKIVEHSATFGHYGGCLFKVAILGTQYVIDMKAKELKRL